MQVANACKKIEVSKYDKRGAVWCAECRHYCITDNENKCNCCFNKVGNQKKHTELKKFDKVLNECELDIKRWMSNPSSRDYEFGWPIRLGIINYFVSVRYLAEYMELPNLEGENKYAEFLETVKRECIVLPRYMYAIK